jgi:hypothetical protein
MLASQVDCRPALPHTAHEIVARVPTAQGAAVSPAGDP